MAASMEVLRERARKLRSTPTGAEHHLVYWLKKAGLKTPIQRQVVIGSMIIDIAIPSRNLLIEVDGPIHAMKRMQDARRTAWLESCGFNVVRVTNREVLKGGLATATAILHGTRDTEENKRAFARAKTVAKKAAEKNGK